MRGPPLYLLGGTHVDQRYCDGDKQSKWGPAMGSITCKVCTGPAPLVRAMSCPLPSEGQGDRSPGLPPTLRLFWKEVPLVG